MCSSDLQVAIVSLERLYPLPTKEVADALARYTNATDVRWVQEEPLNQGAYPFMAQHLPGAIAEAMPGYELKLTVAARPEASAPSVGSMKVHQLQEKDLFERAFTD